MARTVLAAWSRSSAGSRISAPEMSPTAGAPTSSTPAASGRSSPASAKRPRTSAATRTSTRSPSRRRDSPGLLFACTTRTPANGRCTGPASARARCFRRLPEHSRTESASSSARTPTTTCRYSPGSGGPTSQPDRPTGSRPSPPTAARPGSATGTWTRPDDPDRTSPAGGRYRATQGDALRRGYRRANGLPIAWRCAGR